MRDDHPDRPPKHALPLAEALEKITPELEERRLAREREALAAWQPSGDPADRYFAPRVERPPDTEDLFRFSAMTGEILTWGREATPGGVWRKGTISRFDHHRRMR